MARIGSAFGKKLLTYWINQNLGQVAKSLGDLNAAQGGTLPPFAVIGLGRCGCHVTAELAAMVSLALYSNKEENGQSAARPTFLKRLFSVGPDSDVLAIQPMLVVGDIDETTIEDVFGLLRHAGDQSNVASRILHIDYKPLAVGGAGHCPPLAEFFTRGLLALPPKTEGDDLGPWQKARTYLIDSCTTAGMKNPRLVFYVFGAGGGTGAGSAAEIMRAQRFAITTSQADPQIYFTGLAVLPSDLMSNRIHLINTGRTIVQYLAELNIVLKSPSDYVKAPAFQSGSVTEFDKAHKPKPMMPWDGLGFISNDVMAAAPLGGFEMAETSANQYIAQQMFNLAASQMSVASYVQGSGAKITKHNFQSRRLDPQDLRTGMVGPYAICFSASTSQEVMGKVGLDTMLIRAISLPHYNNLERSDASKIVEGISLAPEEKETYKEKIRPLIERFLTDGKNRSEATPLSENDFESLREIPLFKRCPRIIYVFTAPQHGEIPGDIEERMQDLADALFPNLGQMRSAIIRGTTAYYTLSIYIEGSVVLCPDIQSTVRNYIRLLWRPREGSIEEFKATFETVVNQNPPIDEKPIVDWLGENEDPSNEFPNFKNIIEGLHSGWEAFVHNSQESSERKLELQGHRVETTYLNAKEIAAALRYINYIGHFVQPVIV